MNLQELIADKQVLLSLAPEELAFQVLQVAKSNLQNGMVHPQTVFNTAGYGGESEVELAIAEAWRWLDP